MHPVIAEDCVAGIAGAKGKINLSSWCNYTNLATLITTNSLNILTGILIARMSVLIQMLLLEGKTA